MEVSHSVACNAVEARPDSHGQRENAGAFVSERAHDDVRQQPLGYQVNEVADGIPDDVFFGAERALSFRVGNVPGCLAAFCHDAIIDAVSPPGARA